MSRSIFKNGTTLLATDRNVGWIYSYQITKVNDTEYGLLNNRSKEYAFYSKHPTGLVAHIEQVMNLDIIDIYNN